VALIRKFIDKIRNRPPKIKTPWGYTTESMRLRAALNMRADPEIKRRVEELLVGQYGSVAVGLAEARRRYREAYEEDDDDAESTGV
jgi:hypothetical protein